MRSSRRTSMPTVRARSGGDQSDHQTDPGPQHERDDDERRLPIRAPSPARPGRCGAPNSASISSSPDVSMLPIASAAENTTPMTASVGRRVLMLERPDEERPDDQGRDPAQHRVDPQHERHADPGKGNVRDRVGGEGHAAHDGEAADESRRHGHGDRERERLRRNGRHARGT